ncbi:MAG: HAMP domain-containing protein, partial [Desulfofustis sp.]|nr:HAMP domain-containing protein [Desulfofustis sp.]
MVFPRPRSVSAILNLLILIAVLPVLGILVHSNIEQRQHHIEDAEREVLLITRSTAEVLAGVTDSVRQTLTTLASIDAIRNGDLPHCSDLLRTTCAGNPRIYSLSLTDATGTVLAASRPFSSLSLADRRHVQQALATGQFAPGEYIVTRLGDQKSSFSFAYPIHGQDGSVRMVLTAVLFLDRISGFLDFTDLPDGSFMAITDYQGIRVLYHPASETNPIGTPIRPGSWEIGRNCPQAKLFRHRGSDGQKRIFAVEPLRLSPEESPYMYAWAGIPEERIQQPLNVTLLRNLLLVALITGVAMAISRLIGTVAFIRPMRQLVATTASLARGTLSARSGLADHGGEIGALAGAFDNMADSLQRSREKLQQREFHLEEAQRIAHIGSWEWDAEQDVFLWSKELYQILEVHPDSTPPALSQLQNALDPESSAEMHTALLDTLRHGNAFEKELQRRRADSTTGWLIVRGERVAPARLRGTVLDISARKQAEIERQAMHEQLLHSQRLESIGRLAGGVAHDFNNMLGVIIGYTELSLRRLPPDDPVQTNLLEVHKAATRSSELVRQLLAFARRQTASPQVLDLNTTITSMLTMLQRLIGEDIVLLWQPAAHLWPVRIDPGQVDQILANLCVNARDAMDGAGSMRISTGNVTIDGPRHHGMDVCPPGDYTQLAVSDDGCGMDAETSRQIFEPFFTTKGGKGAGLGMSIVKNIVDAHQGTIECQSRPGEGTTFFIRLPLHRQDHMLKNLLWKKRLKSAQRPLKSQPGRFNHQFGIRFS